MPDAPHPWTISLSITAILISVASLWQSCSTANVTKSIARPLIYSTEAYFTKKPTAGEIPIVGVTLKNFGQLPAQNISTQFNVRILPLGKKLKKIFDKETADSYTEDILGNQDETFINYERGEPLTAQDVQALKQGTKTLFYYGEAMYEVSRGGPTTLEWCWKYKPIVNENEFWRCDSAEVEK
jgi:hypothetical protein